MNTVQVKIKLIHPNAKIPTRATEFAGGWDVYAADIKRIRRDWFEVDLGFSLEFSNRFRVMLQPRSSITKTDLIQQNSPGIGDSDYRGSYKFIFKVIPNDSSHLTGELMYHYFPYSIGDRVGQMYLEEIIPISFEQIDELSDTERGEGGFGSTGK